MVIAVGSRSLKILQGKERSSIKVSYNDIIDANGKVKIDPEINWNLIEIRQSRQGDIVLKVGGIVGRLPINSKLAIDISPKFPMGNLARLMSISDDNLSQKMNVCRSYEMTATDGYLPELLLKNLSEYIKRAGIEGAHKQYIKKSIDSSLRPRINFMKSSQRFWAKGQMTRSISEHFFFTRSNPVNQILFEACKTSIALSRNVHGMEPELNSFVRFLYGMPKFNPTSYATLIALYPEALAAIPSFKPNLAKALEISIEIIKRSGVSYLIEGTGIDLPSYLINLETAFESYIRNILSKGSRNTDKAIIVGDGNKQPWKKPLFNNQNINEAKPDLVLAYEEVRKPIIIGDVKYKREVKVEDRYQVISHALSYNVKIAFLCYPVGNNQQSGLIKIGDIGRGTSNITLYEYRIDLEADLEKEEKTFVKTILDLALIHSRLSG